MTDKALLNLQGWTSFLTALTLSIAARRRTTIWGQDPCVQGKAGEGCCCGLNCVPLKPHAEALTPRIQNVTALGVGLLKRQLNYSEATWAGNRFP